MTRNLPIDKDVNTILSRLQGEGHEAYIVGGAVRDLILGRTPKDFDIATSATPSQIKKVFGRGARIIGRRFRLVHLYMNRVCYEISTFRREPTEAERTSRQDDDGVMIWRDNQYGNLEQDALRRDFTVNSLYYSPLASPPFRDFCDGRKDLDTGTVRAIGDPDRRLSEDPVRIIRALKLVGEYQFKLSRNLVAPLRARAVMLKKCSQTRMFEELLKILQKPYTVPTLEALHKYGALAAFLPALDRHWKKPVGKATRSLLAIRDARMADAHFYSKSRVQALATLAYPFICDGLGTPQRELYGYRPGIERDLRDGVMEFLDPLPLPRALTTRTRDVLLLLPRFGQTKGRQRVIGHPEYRYARELFSILAEAFGWAPEVIEPWPVLGTGHPHKSRNRSSQHNRRRRSHRRKRQE